MPGTPPTVTLAVWIDMAATALFSVTGAMVAVRKQYDLVGLFALAFACGLGGGLLRDGLFIQAGPPAAMRQSFYLVAVLVGCLIAALFFTHVDRLSKPFLILDALGTGAYGAVGASKAMEAGLAIPACIFVGVVNAVGGGLIRDVLARDEPLMLKPGNYYAVASFLGVCAYMVLTLSFHVPLLVAASGAIAVTFILRILAISFDWKTKAIRPVPPRND